MYYVIKLIQAAGLTFILIAFIKKFPNIMDLKLFGIGIGVFTCGWVLQKFILKSDQ